MEPPARRGTKIRRRLLTATVVLAACASGGLVIAPASAPSATQAAPPQRLSWAGAPSTCSRCRRRRLRGPPGQARIQAPFPYRGSGPAVAVRCALGRYAGPPGDEPSGPCGARVFRRTVAWTVVREDAAERLAVAGHGLRVPARHRLPGVGGTPVKQPMT